MCGREKKQKKDVYISSAASFDSWICIYIYMIFFFCSFTVHVFTQIYHVCVFKFMITSLLGSPVYVASVWQEQGESGVHLPCVMTKISCNICFTVFSFYWR